MNLVDVLSILAVLGCLTASPGEAGEPEWLHCNSISIHEEAPTQAGSPPWIDLEVGETVSYFEPGQGAWEVTRFSYPAEPTLLGLDASSLPGGISDPTQGKGKHCVGSYQFDKDGEDCGSCWATKFLDPDPVAIVDNCGGCRVAARFALVECDTPNGFEFSFKSNLMKCGTEADPIPIHCPDDPESVLQEMVIECGKCTIRTETPRPSDG